MQSIYNIPYFCFYKNFRLFLHHHTCSKKMKCKIKVLFISIALSFLLGQIANCNFYTSEVRTLYSGTAIAENTSFSNCIPELEDMPFYNEDSSSLASLARSQRYLSKNKRSNSYPSSKSGFIFTQRNNYLNYSNLYIESEKRFSSGLTEAKQYLISLGKLII